MKYLRKISVSIVMMIVIVVMVACGSITPSIGVGFEEKIIPKSETEVLFYHGTIGGNVEVSFPSDGVVVKPCVNGSYSWADIEVERNNFNISGTSFSIPVITETGFHTVPAYVCVEVDSRVE